MSIEHKNKSPLTIRVVEDIAIVTIDVPGESVNTINTLFAEAAEEIFARIEKDPLIKGAVLISGKKDSFIAGADINMIKPIKTANEARQLSQKGHQQMQQIVNSRKPVVAAIHGACLGGGYELALACHARIASEDMKTVLGLPEVMLGLLPGGGGTQRLPRLIGIAKALDLMLTGRQIRPVKALKLGMIDEVVPRSILLETALKWVSLLLSGQTGKKRKKNIQDVLLENNPLGFAVLFQQAKKNVLAKTKGNYPAPLNIIKCVSTGIKKGIKAGLDLEAQLFGELVVSEEADQLMGIFQANNELKKENFCHQPNSNPKKINRLSILGGGLMGTGIAFVSIEKADCAVRLKDVDLEGVFRAKKQISHLYQKKVKRGHLSRNEANKKMATFSGGIDYQGFGKSDMVIEAVFESLELKRRMVEEVEAITPFDTIFATNTSSLLVSDIAKEAKRPQNIVGMHYFSPVDKMPLLEVIVQDKTSDHVIQSSVDLGRKQGKTVIVVKDSPGFYVNRILGPYICEANWLVSEGISVDLVDQTLVNWGFPVGPFTLLDEVGLDVAFKTEENLVATFGQRLKSPGLGKKMIKDGRLGKKAGKGIYLYQNRGKKKQVDPDLYKLLQIKPSKKVSPKEIVDRTVLLFVNEAVRCLEEGIIQSPRDGDLGAIFGTGFAPFYGGPFRYVDSLGADCIVKELQKYTKVHGERFEPAPLLIKKAKKSENFYS
ncbi:MAG: fatty acid oxidation complex subunit alpha FadJ [Proteobacteria bacterium]|nr:fatty acid oxidation complex subunit alpha FadJ [Pseudomonadota bacterium]